MKETMDNIGVLIGAFVIMPFLVYAALGFASAIFGWLTAKTTPLWHRYLMCLGIGGVVWAALQP